MLSGTLLKGYPSAGSNSNSNYGIKEFDVTGNEFRCGSIHEPKFEKQLSNQLTLEFSKVVTADMCRLYTPGYVMAKTPSQCSP